MAEDEPISESGTLALAVRPIEHGSHQFVVKNYSSQCKEAALNKLIQSEQFTVGGYIWTIRFYPGGRTIEAHNAGNASLFVYLKSQTTAPVEISLSLYILDQSGKNSHYRKSSSTNVPPRRLILNYNEVGGFFNFINKRTILESLGYLKDDCLKIHATISVRSFHIQDMPLIEVPKEFKMESSQGADVTFKVAGESFCAHKCILAARSPVFMSCLSDDNQRQEIVIPDMEPSIFKALLSFIYTGTILEEKQEALDDSGSFIFKSFWGKMLASADQFELKGLKKICESHIFEKLSAKSVAYLLHLADVYQASELRDACFAFVAENQDDFMDSDGCEHLKEACPLLYLDLVGYSENLVQLNRGKDLNVCNKIFSVVKDSFFGMFLPLDATATDMQMKAKEA